MGPASNLLPGEPAKTFLFRIVFSPVLVLVGVCGRTRFANLGTTIQEINMNLFSPSSAPRTQYGSKAGILAMTALALAGLPAMAQVTLYGTLSNFDVINNTGGEVHGFEIEFQGVSSVNSYYNWNRYGPPQVVPIPSGTGVYVRWMSPYDSITGTFITGTPINNNPTPTAGHSCVIGTQFYSTSGCEHFGLTTNSNASKTIYRWLVADPANPGQLIAGPTQVSIPAPVWIVQPPVKPADPFVIVAQVDPPIPPPLAKRFGDAQWMKTYKTENLRQVNLDELVADNLVVPQDPAQIETAWDLMQTDLLDAGGRRRQKRGALGGGNHAVVRRFEIYKYAGAVDPATGQALCIDPTCVIPDPSEIGDFAGAQNAAANLNGPNAYPVTVTVSGDGLVADGNQLIKCPGTCTTNVVAGGTVTLTATNRKDVFTGWSGACNSASPTCTFTVNSDAPVTANFKTLRKLVLKGNGSGSISSNPAGSSFLDGTSVTATAVPGAGATWKGWTGGICSGLALTCTVTMNADLALTANFR
jgi:hypothetical protein